MTDMLPTPENNWLLKIVFHLTTSHIPKEKEMARETTYMRAIIDTTSGSFYKRQLSQEKFMYLDYNIVQIHQFLLTQLSLMKRTGGSNLLSILGKNDNNDSMSNHKRLKSQYTRGADA
jgi:hypothetical protein